MLIGFRASRVDGLRFRVRVQLCSRARRNDRSAVGHYALYINFNHKSLRGFKRREVSTLAFHGNACMRACVCVRACALFLGGGGGWVGGGGGKRSFFGVEGHLSNAQPSEIYGLFGVFGP